MIPIEVVFSIFAVAFVFVLGTGIALAIIFWALRKRVGELEGALTPSAATKAAYIGEFTIAVERIVNEDEEPVDDGADAPDPYDHIQVPWTTIKQIMAAIRAFALPTPKEPTS